MQVQLNLSKLDVGADRVSDYKVKSTGQKWSKGHNNYRRITQGDELHRNPILL